MEIRFHRNVGETERDTVDVSDQMGDGREGVLLIGASRPDFVVAPAGLEPQGVPRGAHLDVREIVRAPCPNHPAVSVRRFRLFHKPNELELFSFESLCCRSFLWAVQQ